MLDLPPTQDASHLYIQLLGVGRVDAPHIRSCCSSFYIPRRCQEQQPFFSFTDSFQWCSASSQYRGVAQPSAPVDMKKHRIRSKFQCKFACEYIVKNVGDMPCFYGPLRSCMESMSDGEANDRIGRRRLPHYSSSGAARGMQIQVGCDCFSKTCSFWWILRCFTKKGFC